MELTISQHKAKQLVKALEQNQYALENLTKSLNELSAGVELENQSEEQNDEADV